MDRRHIELIERAEANEGLVLRADLPLLGFTKSARRHLLVCGDFEPYGPRLLRRTGSPPTPKQRVLGAVLDAGPGGYLCAEPAVAWWGLPGFDLRGLRVVRPRGITSTRPVFAKLHEVVCLLPHHVTVLDGVPVVRPERAFIEVCSRAHPARAARMLDNAWARGLLSGPSTRRVLDELAASGRNGIVEAREILDDRPDDYVPPASNLEARIVELLRRIGMRARRQVDSGGDRWTGRVDFRTDDRPLIIEVQSERYHASLSDKADDARRRAQLEADGFVVVEVWDVDIWHHPDDVLRAILAADRTARAVRSDAKTRWGQAS